MSCYNWEEGTIRLPSAVYAKFRKTFVEAACLRERLDFEEAAKIIEGVRTKTIALPAAGSLLDQVLAVLHEKARVRQPGQEWVLDRWAIARAVTHDVPPADPGRPAWDQPQPIARKTVKALRKTLLKAYLHDSKSRAFHGDGAEVSFDDKKHTVTWAVSENNHAVERARDSFLGTTLFGMLAKVQWTRGSGGEIVGNDEYRRDNRGSGGGANYVTRSFGPHLHAARTRTPLALPRSVRPYV